MRRFGRFPSRLSVAVIKVIAFCITPTVAVTLHCAAMGNSTTITLDRFAYGTYGNDGFNNYNSASIVAGFALQTPGARETTQPAPFAIFSCPI